MHRGGSDGEEERKKKKNASEYNREYGPELVDSSNGLGVALCKI